MYMYICRYGCSYTHARIFTHSDKRGSVIRNSVNIQKIFNILDNATSQGVASLFGN